MSLVVVQNAASKVWSKMPAPIILTETVPYASADLYKAMVTINVFDYNSAPLRTIVQTLYLDIDNQIEINFTKIADDTLMYHRTSNIDEREYQNLVADIYKPLFDAYVFVNIGVESFIASSPSAVSTITLSQIAVYHGGVPAANNYKNDFLSHLSNSGLNKFFTHINYATIFRSQKLFLDFYADPNLTFKVLKATVIDLVGAQSEYDYDIAAMTVSSTEHLYRLLLGGVIADVFGASTDGVAKIIITIHEDATYPTLISPITYIVDNKNYKQVYGLLYLNSYMALDSIMICGAAQIGVDNSSTLVTKYGDVGFGRFVNGGNTIAKIRSAYFDNIGNTETVRWRLRTTKMGKEQLMRTMREIMLHRKIWMQDDVNARFVPMLVTTNKLTIIDEQNQLHAAEFDAVEIIENSVYSPRFEELV